MRVGGGGLGLYKALENEIKTGTSSVESHQECHQDWAGGLLSKCNAKHGFKAELQYHTVTLYTHLRNLTNRGKSGCTVLSRSGHYTVSHFDFVKFLTKCIILVDLQQ